VRLVAYEYHALYILRVICIRNCECRNCSRVVGVEGWSDISRDSPCHHAGFPIIKCVSNNLGLGSV